MTDRQRQELEDALTRMSDEEKQELIERLFRSLKPRNERAVTPRPGTVAQRLSEIASLPAEGPSDGFSGADHDRVVYGA